MSGLLSLAQMVGGGAGVQTWAVWLRCYAASFSFLADEFLVSAKRQDVPK